MIVNGQRLLAASPIVGMLTGKQKAGGITYGLAEVGYDVRINQAPPCWWARPNPASKV